MLLDPLPDWIDPEAWKGFCDMRKKIKKPLTSGAITRILKALERLRNQGYDPNLVLNQSEDKCYTGVFPLSEGYLESLGMEVKSGLQERLESRDWAH